MPLAAVVITWRNTPRSSWERLASFSRRLNQEKLIVVMYVTFIIPVSRKSVFGTSGANPDEPFAPFHHCCAADGLPALCPPIRQCRFASHAGLQRRRRLQRERDRAKI